MAISMADLPDEEKKSTVDVIFLPYYILLLIENYGRGIFYDINK